jgi:3-hydroxybutyryl-CoA dehydrogenase
MRLGTNYPLGPLAWGDRWGAATVYAILTAVHAAEGDHRYQPSTLLRRRALTGGNLR